MDITVTELARNLADYINRVVYRRERFRLTRGARAVAELTPVPMGLSLFDLPALVEGLPHLDPEDLETFADDVERERESLPPLESDDPWDS